MASLTIRQLDESIKQKLRLQAAQNGHSMEAEARAIFTKLFSNNTTQIGIASLIQNIVKKVSITRENFIEQPNRKPKPSHRQLDFSDEAYG